MEVSLTDIVTALAETIGEKSVVTDHDIVSSYLTDWTGRFRGEAFCVVRPVNSKQVRDTVDLAKRFDVPLVAQGGNTGLVGGATPVKKAIILSTKLLSGIELDHDLQLAKVGAGVTLSALNAEAQKAGLKLGVDLASRDSATVGGMVATNAGGIHVIRYGGMRRQVLGIEAVLGNGRLISRMEGLEKDNSGFDWPSILCGSEGTLGVITQLTLKLVSVPRHRAVALVALHTLSAALAVMTEARRRLGGLSAMEFMTSNGIELVSNLDGAPWPFNNIPSISLLVEAAGEDDQMEKLAYFLDSLEDVVDAVMAGDSAADGLWYWRESHTLAISRKGVARKLDVSIPIRAIPAFVDDLTHLLENDYQQVKPILFGHLGDGNIHVNLLDVAEGDTGIEHRIYKMVSTYGGSISAKHGIGRAKVNELALTRSQDDIESMKSVKSALDPASVLNPGVLFV